jgi:hypothetical protein
MPSSTTVKSDGWSTSYYELPRDASELQDLIEHRQMNFSVGNIFKAAYRLGRKDGATTLYDLNKIRWYAEREIARLEAEKEELTPFEHVN